MTEPLPLLHTCGCVLERYEPSAPFAACPLHGFGQEAVGVRMVHDALGGRHVAGRVIVFPGTPGLEEGPRRCR